MECNFSLLHNPRILNTNWTHDNDIEHFASSPGIILPQGGTNLHSHKEITKEKPYQPIEKGDGG